MSDLSNHAWRVARIAHRCQWCGEHIFVGERHLHYWGRWEGDWQNWRMHAECYGAYEEEEIFDEGFISYENERPMNATKWATCENPEEMLDFVNAKMVSDRKLRLFGCAALRQVWDLIPDPRTRHAVEVAERLADGQATAEEWKVAHYHAVGDTAPVGSLAMAVCYLGTTVELSALFINTSRRPWPENSGPIQAALVREIFGNPFQPVVWRDGKCPNGTKISPNHLWGNAHCLACGFPGETAVEVAREAYENRDERGHLDPARLGVVADALEDFDYGDHQQERVVSHLRGQGPHVRGCACLDLILGKY